MLFKQVADGQREAGDQVAQVNHIVEMIGLHELAGTIDIDRLILRVDFPIKESCSKINLALIADVARLVCRRDDLDCPERRLRLPVCTGEWGGLIGKIRHERLTLYLV